MANLTKCVSCDACEGCVTCQGCISCESFCENGGQNSQNGFTFKKCISSGQAITSDNTGFNREDWKTAISRINEVFLTGTQRNAAESTIPMTNNDLVYMTAAEFKRVANAADYTSDENNIYPGAVMKGTYFFNLQDKVANLHYKWNQCNICDSKCDQCVTCDGGCNAGKQKTIETYCCSCNTGETATK